MSRPGRWPIALLATVSVAACVGTARQAVERFHRPPPASMVETERWYDKAVGSGLHALIATACVVYLIRAKRHERRVVARQSSVVLPRPWRQKVELRVVLYAIAAWFALQLPLGIIQASRALTNDPPPWRQSIWTAFPKMGLIGPPVAVAIVVYDRRRVRRESREAAGECLTCGYDLRATPERCPECGTPFQVVP